MSTVALACPPNVIYTEIFFHNWLEDDNIILMVDERNRFTNASGRL